MHTPVTRPTAAVAPILSCLHTPSRAGASRTTGLRALAALALAVAGAVGCDDMTSADKQIRQTLAESRYPESDEERQQSIESLEQAHKVADASPAAKAQAAAALAHAEMEEAARLMREVDRNQRDIAQLVYEISQLGSLIKAGNTDVAAYRLAEPGEARKLAQQLVAEAEGGADKRTWLTDKGAELLTLAAARQEISRLEGEIASKREQINQLTQQREAARKQAQEAFAQAESQSGQQAVETFTRGAEARQKAENIATEIELVEASVVPLQQDLAVAQGHQQAAQMVIQQYQQLTQRLNQGWEQIQQQAQQQAQVASTILGREGGGGGAGATTSGSVDAGLIDTRTIADKARLLDQKLTAAKDAFDNAEQYLNNAVTHYGDAVTHAETVAREVKSRSAGYERSSPVRQAFDALVETVNPAVYKLAQADASQMLAMLHASRVISLRERSRMLEQLQPTLEQAKLEVPPALRDIAPEAEVAASRDAALAKFEEAGKLYLDVMEGALGNDARKNAARVGRILALYGQVQLARAMGDDATANERLAEAVAARELAEQNNAILPAMPIELAPAAAAAPTTGPTTAPTTAPVEREAAPTAAAF